MNPGLRVTQVAEFYTKVTSISGYSVWNLFHITHLPLVILRQPLHFRKIWEPLLYAYITTSHTLHHYNHFSLRTILNNS